MKQCVDYRRLDEGGGDETIERSKELLGGQREREAQSRRKEADESKGYSGLSDPRKPR